MKVRYIGSYYKVVLEKGKTYSPTSMTMGFSPPKILKSWKTPTINVRSLICGYFERHKRIGGAYVLFARRRYENRAHAPALPVLRGRRHRRN